MIRTPAVDLLRLEILKRLRKGERVVLYGRRGSGKSTVVAMLQEDIEREHMPCGHCTATAHLDDITRALERAYPTVDVTAICRRAARSRLYLAADQRQGVLLLDHVTEMNNAMVGFLRRLVGGIVSVLLVLDVDTPGERARVRPGRLGGLALQMPSLASTAMRSLLGKECARRGFPTLDPATRHRLLHSALGRPGWIVQCATLAEQQRYWREERLALLNLLCSDTEIAVRYGTQTLADLEFAARATRSARLAAAGELSRMR